MSYWRSTGSGSVLVWISSLSVVGVRTCTTSTQPHLPQNSVVTLREVSQLNFLMRPPPSQTPWISQHFAHSEWLVTPGSWSVREQDKIVHILELLDDQWGRHWRYHWQGRPISDTLSVAEVGIIPVRATPLVLGGSPLNWMVSKPCGRSSAVCAGCSEIIAPGSVRLRRGNRGARVWHPMCARAQRIDLAEVQGLLDEADTVRQALTPSADTPSPTPPSSSIQEQDDLQLAVAAPSAPLPDSLNNLIWVRLHRHGIPFASLSDRSQRFHHRLKKASHD